MKPCLLTILFLSLSNLSWAFDIRGAWYGSCTYNGQTAESFLNVSQNGKSINLGDQEYSRTYLLGTTQSAHSEGVNDDVTWRELKIYHWQWSEDKTMILMNSDWLGWNVDQGGTWSGRSRGHIKKVGEQLEIKHDYQLNFDNSSMRIVEICHYDKE